MWRLAPTLALLLAVACNDPVADFVFLGDSITAGVVGGPPGPGYVAQLQDFFGSQLTIGNAGCNAATTRAWLLVPFVEVLFFPCSFVDAIRGPFDVRMRPLMPNRVTFILLGTNDSVFNNVCPIEDAGTSLCGPAAATPIEADEYELNLRLLIARLLLEDLSGAIQVVLLQPPEPPLASQQPRALRIREYGNRMERICSDTLLVRCGPDLKQVIGPEDYDSRDNLHPTIAGHTKIAGAIVSYIVSEGLLPPSPP